MGQSLQAGGYQHRHPSSAIEVLFIIITKAPSQFLLHSLSLHCNILHGYLLNPLIP